MSATTGPILNIEALTFAPPANFGGGSIGIGSIYVKTKRIGGAPQYGNVLINTLNTALISAPNFDVGLSSWNTATNQTGGSVQGMWAGALSPAFNQTFSNGSFVGMTVNAGNRFGNLGIITDLTGGTRYGIGLQVGADLVPSQDAQAFYTVTNITIGASSVISIAGLGVLEGMAVFFQTSGGTLPGGLAVNTRYFCRNPSFGTFQVALTAGGSPITTTGSFASPVTALLQWPTPFGISVNAGAKGNQWGVGYFLAKSSIQVGGYGHYEWGGPNATGQPLCWAQINGFWQQGLDLSLATFSSGTAIKLGTGDSAYWSFARITSMDTGNGLEVTTGNTTAFGRLSANDATQLAVQWGATATAPKLGLFGVTPVIKPATTGTAVGFVAGTGTGVNNDSTFTGNVGATAYRISDIVKALKDLGALTV